ncbi:hypothetical protein FAZ95_35815 [Trinickia violacea]|uniref:Uncharacterized protein n=1 Tax=Trinickia violacea TaxID=2571746 RepID=A0A4P8J1T0_9BURK|nr:hypothetical protein [Trinickia violacea]QCP54325.1 hypothetical protein FAZ95_35815 [Trinickia violacea]
METADPDCIKSIRRRLRDKVGKRVLPKYPMSGGFLQSLIKQGNIKMMPQLMFLPIRHAS